MTLTINKNLSNLTQTERDAHIRASQNQVIERLSSNPAKAVTTLSMSGTADDGLTCRVQQGRHTALMDMGAAMGGEARGPSPGFHARAGIVGCVAIATKMAAAREGLAFRSVLVDLEMDSDDLAIFGLGGMNAAPIETRITIHIDTDEPEPVVADLVGRVLEMDPWFLALRDAQEVRINWQRS